MTASSQNPPGAQPPELPPAPALSAAERAAYAAYDVAVPAPAGPLAPASHPDLPDCLRYPEGVPFRLRVPFPEPQLPECCVCTGREGALRPDPDGRRYPSGAQVLFCLTHVPLSFAESAAQAGRGTPDAITEALQAAGAILTPERAQEIWDEGHEQAKAEAAAELVQAAQDRTTLAWLRERWRAVGRLCEGRLHTDLLTVSEVLEAADGNAPTGAPLAVTWGGVVMGPSGDTEGENTLVPCTTARGGAAALVLDDEQRQALGSLLGLQVRDIHAPCATDGCGTVDDYDASDPSLFGWSRLEVAALGDSPRWYCSDRCVFDALARAGHDLAADDQTAAIDPHAQAPAPVMPTPDAEAEAVRRSVNRAFPTVAAFLADERPGGVR